MMNASNVVVLLTLERPEIIVSIDDCTYNKCLATKTTGCTKIIVSIDDQTKSVSTTSHHRVSSVMER
jgi:hypothetical protein